MNIIQKPSPNFSVGRGSQKPELIVIHIMEGTLSGTDSWFASPSSQVSAHYGVGMNGDVHQYVNEYDTAWHAGRVLNHSFSLCKLNTNPNEYTIGIEHEGKSNSIWSPAMKKASSDLIREICRRWNIPIDRNHIIGHYQVFSGKPNCPAVNKGIIDELIALAQPIAPTPPPTPAPQPGKVEQATKLLEQALSNLKS